MNFGNFTTYMWSIKVSFILQKQRWNNQVSPSIDLSLTKIVFTNMHWYMGYNGEDSSKIPSQGQIVSVQAASGVFAGAVSSLTTTPFDTVKTRLQVLNSNARPSVKQTIKQLMEEDGWQGFYRGLGPRFFSMSAWGTSMILAYEYLKRISARNG